MDGIRIEQLKEMLMARRKQVAKPSDHEIADTEESLHQAEIIDMAQSLEQIGRETSLAEQERRELLAIERALAKMSSGGFGTCEDCGEEIPSRRLLVLPEARLCAHCQTFEERQLSRMRAFGSR